MAKAPLSPLEKVLSEAPSQGLPDFQFNATERQPSASSSAAPTDLMPLFEQSAVKYNVPVNVLLALGDQESKFNPRALGQPTKWGRAKGLMQYLDSTAANLGINPYDPGQSIDAAARQIRERLDKGYSMEDAVKEHFAGPDRRQWGPKTARYGEEVMEKVAKWGGQFQPTGTAGAPANPDQPQAVAQLQKMLDEEEPGRYTALTPDQVERYQRRAAMMQGDALAATQPFVQVSAPSPLTIENQQRQQQQQAEAQPSPLTLENQNRLAAGLPPKDTREYQSFLEATGASLENVPERFQDRKSVV